MAGYCVELYKYLRMDEDKCKKDKLIAKKRNILNEDDREIEDGNFLAYGEFDRIGIERIERFPRYRDVSERARTWIGDRQTILLYEIDRERDSFTYENNNFYVKTESEPQQSNHLFLGITILQFKYSQKKECKDMKEFLRHTRKKILKLVNEKYEDLSCSVFGMLGSFGIAIFWLADQYVDVLKAVTQIRNMSFSNRGNNKSDSAFLSAYTIFAQNHPIYCDTEQQEERRKKIAAIKGEAILHITLKNGVNQAVINEVKNACGIPKEQVMHHTTGEYDITVRINSNESFLVFQKGELLYCDSSFFQKNILQTSLQLCECLSENALEAGCEDKPSEKERDKQEALPFLDDIQKNYKILRKQFQEFPSTAGMIDTLDLLYSDYIAKISTASNEMWESNFSYQFFKILECLEEFNKNKEHVSMPRESVLKIINELLGDFERQISHIAESNNLFLGTPTCQFRYSGNNNLTLYAYFEFIKEILNYIYLSQEISNQAEIIPLIVGDIVPIIQSTLFIDYNNKEDSRIVTINLPMGALYNPVFYFPYLYHEIFHYVVPRDRYVRNEITGMMISIEILNSIIKYIIIQELHLDEDAIKLLDLFINKYIFRYTYSFVIRKFESDIDPSFRELRKRKLTNAQMNEEVKDAEQYEKSLFYRWINWCNEKKNIQLVNNPIQLYLIDLYSHKGNIEQELNMWLKDDLIEQDKKRGDRLKKISAVIGGFRKFTDNTDADLIDQAFEEAMNALNDNVVNDARLLVKAIKEAMADLAMVQLNAMEFVEYLLIFTKTDKDLTIDDKSKPEKEVQDVVRIGMILEYFCRRREDSGNYIGCIEAGKEDFINMYCGLYYSSHADNTKDTVNKLVKEAEEWFAHWVNCYKVYCCRYCSYKELVKKMWQQSLAGDSKMSPVSEYWKEFIHSLKEYGYFIRTADDKTPKSDWKERRQELDRRVFDVNLEVVYKYQAQRNFSDLNRNRKNVIERCNEESYIFDGKINDELNMSQIKLSWKRMINRKYIYEYKIDSIGSLGTVILEIVEQLKEANRRLLGKREYPIWYRGHQSKDYKLLPSIMRKFKEYEEKVRDPKDATLLKMFRREYEEFKFRADGAYEMIDRTGYTDSDYIALMQHYSVASNYLDWTEDALSSLYFAVEEFMDDKADSVDSDAALYIFSPALYNYDRVKLMREAKRDDTGLLEIEKRIIREVSKDIPNLTAPFNKGRYDVYMLGNDEYTDENDKLFSAESIGNKAAYYTPLAIYTSRINKRIQAQNGMFLAYNIYTPRSQEDEFDYIALEKIQDRYLNVFSSDEETYPFLYKIIIQKETKEDVAKWIKAFGMSKERCYPELSNIGERIMR